MPSNPDDLSASFDPALPLARAHTIPASWYLDPALADRERRDVFGATWQVAGRVDQVERPGAYFTAEVAGQPLVVVRDGQTLRAFYNVCRHRAARVAPEGAGTCSRFRCHYHGWTYDLAGQLRGTPEFDGVEDFARETNGLVPVQVSTWGPLVWVHLGDGRPALNEWLAPLEGRRAEMGLDGLRFVARKEYELACNWKVFVDNYLDGGYHVNTVHPGLADVLDYKLYRTELFEGCSLQSSPLVAGGLGDVRGGATAWYWWVFPNLMLNVYEGVLDTNVVVPLGPERCRVTFDFYFRDTQGEKAERFMARSMEVAHQVQLEDAGVCEEVQRGLASWAFQTGRFSVRREAGGYHFHQLLARWLRRPG